MLEDKLRELRLLALDPREYDDRVVTLSQLDSLRRELLATAQNSLRQVDFGKVLHSCSHHALLYEWYTALQIELHAAHACEVALCAFFEGRLTAPAAAPTRMW
jgi:hypothetical protein